MSAKEVVAAKLSDVREGSMKRVSIEGTNILLSRLDGEVYAVGAFCPHYGAPLDLGVLSGDRVVCPWHHACFNVRTGDLLEPPARDALPAFETRIDGDDILVKLPKDVSDARLPVMVQPDSKAEDRLFVILGAGAAGNAAAQTLREDGYRGRIVMITYENRLPYDRPNLSKEYLQGKAPAEWMALRDAGFYKKYGIEIWQNKRVTEVYVPDKVVKFDDGSNLMADALLIATGGKARRLNVPGSDLKNVFTLRTYDDSDAIIAAGQDASRAVLIGASFIGMEVAFSLRKRKLEVAVVAPEAVPFEQIFGKEIGQLFKELHEENGVEFELGTAIKRFLGSETVEGVELEHGKRLDADLVVVGVGIKPATAFLRGLALADDGSVSVDAHLQAADGVFAAGDIARFADPRTGRSVRIEHWRTAEQHGRLAAHNMAGKKMAYEGVPFFWTAQVGLNFRYVGHAEEWDEIIVRGDIGSREFIALYVSGRQVVAAAGNKRDRALAAIEELMRLGKMPDADALREGSFDWIGLL